MKPHRSADRRPTPLRTAAPRFIDISVPIRPGMPSWPGDPAFEFTAGGCHRRGDAANVSWIGHGGARRHARGRAAALLPGRRCRWTDLPLDCWSVPAWSPGVTRPARHLAQPTWPRWHLPPGITRLLLKTSNSACGAGWTAPADFVGLAPDAAEWIVAARHPLLGMDYLSVEDVPGADGEHPVHKTLLAAGVDHPGRD